MGPDDCAEEIDSERNVPIEIVVTQRRNTCNFIDDDDSEIEDDFHEANSGQKTLLEECDSDASSFRITRMPPDDLDEEISELGVDEETDDLTFCFPTLDSAKESANQFAKKVWEASWKATHFYSLPEWLQDNDFLHNGHRPPLPSFSACFKSIFRVHTETGNIWSHMIGCVAFIGVAVYFLSRPEYEVQWEDKLAFLPFFVGAVACLGMSFAFHTVNCHSERVGKVFIKLDYVGITLLIMGSFIPWLHYTFYCRYEPKVTYMTAIVVLGISCVVVSLLDKFSDKRFRPVRAGFFLSLAASAIIPCCHFSITHGFWTAVYEASLGWIGLMSLLYVSGTMLYAMRIPERFFPGKCDIMFHSHQLFHLLVVAAAFVHYHGVSEMAVQRLEGGSCDEIGKRLFANS